MESHSTRPYWESLRLYGNAIAVLDPQMELSWTYLSLAELVEWCAARLRTPAKSLVFICCENNVGSLACYLGSMAAGNTAYMSPVRINHSSMVETIERYRPEFILWRSGTPSPALSKFYDLVEPIAGYNAIQRSGVRDSPFHPELALLLSTSGSSGGAKLARLSVSGISIAAAQVVNALAVSDRDRAVVALPLAYVYGLTVVNSHLLAGGSVVLERRSPADRSFWDALAHTEVTTFAGVSLTYDFMRMHDIGAGLLPKLEKLTHAGGRIDQITLSWLFQRYAKGGRKVFLMYGQTEASGRISVLPPELLIEKGNSVGRPVQFGGVSISPKDDEIVFTGPNVMLGYASRREDLSRGDDMGGQLHTGDLGFLDRGGLLHITGRSKRICKILGNRINLDVTEDYFCDICAVAVIGEDEHLILFVEGEIDRIRLRARQFISESRLPSQCLTIHKVASLPRTANGKLSYRELSQT